MRPLVENQAVVSALATAFSNPLRFGYSDGVILHEMAHYKYKHHRKLFWDHLSALLGGDAGLARAKDFIAMSPYYDYYLYLTKNK